MAQCSITITVKVAWWVRPYISSLALIARVTGLRPDPDRVQRVLMRGVTVRR